MRLLVLSPHLDDAAFSLGPMLGLLAADHEVTVATPFTGSVIRPRGFALACQLDKGLSAHVDYMELRREEDANWAQALGLRIKHGPLLEAPHRGYESAAALFAEIDESDLVQADLSLWIEALIEGLQPDQIFCPLTVGGHVDHRQVRVCLETIASAFAPLAYYLDQPYAAKTALSLAAVLQDEATGLEPASFKVDASSVRAALEATNHYQSQIDFQFKTNADMKHTLSEAWGEGIALFHKGTLAPFGARNREVKSV